MQTEHVCRHFNSWAVPCSKSFYVITLSRCAAQGLVNGLLTAGKTLLSTSVLLLVSLFIFSCIAVELIAKDIDVTHRDGTESRCVVRPGPWTLHIADIAGRVSCQCSSNSSNCSEATWQIWFVQTFSDFAALYTYFLDSDRFWLFVCFFHFFTRVYFESNGLQVSRPAF